MQIQELVSLLRNLLNDELGVFTDTSQRLKAIAVDPVSKPGTQVEGLLCVIQLARPGTDEELTGGKYHNHSWKIILTQNDPKKSVDPALQLIRTHPNLRVRNVVLIPRMINTPERAIITINDPYMTIY
jgi:hypothetical protein